MHPFPSYVLTLEYMLAVIFETLSKVCLQQQTSHEGKRLKWSESTNNLMLGYENHLSVFPSVCTTNLVQSYSLEWLQSYSTPSIVYILLHYNLKHDGGDIMLLFLNRDEEADQNSWEAAWSWIRNKSWKKTWSMLQPSTSRKRNKSETSGVKL